MRFSRVPKIVKNGGEMLEELTIRRRRAWLSTISRDDLTEDKLENERVCSRHFVSGQAAKPWDQFDVDWVPTLHLGHTKKLQQIDAQLNADRAERRKRRQENIEQEISEKVKKLNEPGETVESIFSEIEHTCTTRESDQLQDGGGEDLGPVHTNAFSKTSVFCFLKTDKKFFVHTSVFVAFSTVHTTPPKTGKKTSVLLFYWDMPMSVT